DRASRVSAFIAAFLVAIFMGQGFSASLRKSPVFDEPSHIAAGLSYVETRVVQANLQHPPLLKELSGLAMMIGGIHWPRTPQTEQLIRGGAGAEFLEWPIGFGIIQSNGPDRVLLRARLPFVLLGGLLGWLIFWWGREMVGERAALFALVLYTFD